MLAVGAMLLLGSSFARLMTFLIVFAVGLTTMTRLAAQMPVYTPLLTYLSLPRKPSALFWSAIAACPLCPKAVGLSAQTPVALLDTQSPPLLAARF